MNAIWKKYSIWIIVGGIALLAFLYYFTTPTATTTDEGSGASEAGPIGQYALDARDQQAYTELLAMIQMTAPNEWPWFSGDIPLYFPGGARATFGQLANGGDVAPGMTSKTLRLITAVGELANYPDWQPTGPNQAWSIYQNYLSAAKLALVS